MVPIKLLGMFLESIDTHTLCDHVCSTHFKMIIAMAQHCSSERGIFSVVCHRLSATLERLNVIILSILLQIYSIIAT